jgi:hypothetical protein
MALRARIASSLECHMSRLAGLVSFMCISVHSMQRPILCVPYLLNWFPCTALNNGLHPARVLCHLLPLQLSRLSGPPTWRCGHASPAAWRAT